MEKNDFIKQLSVKLTKKILIKDFIILVDEKIENLFNNMNILNVETYMEKDCEEKLIHLVRLDYKKYEKKEFFFPVFNFGSLLYDYERKIIKYFKIYNLSLDEIQKYVIAKLGIIKIFDDDYLLIQFFLKVNGEYQKI